MINFQIELDPVPVFKELDGILQKHKEELCLFPDTVLAPDWNVYRKLSRIGKLIVITARQENEIVGYTINIIQRHMHYPFLYGVNDILYMEPELRGHGIRLIKFTEKTLKEKGVSFFSLSIKPHVDFRKVVEKLGYNLLEYQYFRRL